MGREDHKEPKLKVLFYYQKLAPAVPFQAWEGLKSIRGKSRGGPEERTGADYDASKCSVST